jgi:uncharacterized iron-regulated membrane protein
MKLPHIPDTPIQMLLLLGIGLVVFATAQPTELYEQWEGAIAERDEQAAILKAEEEYLNGVDQDSRPKGKELAIQAAEVEQLSRRADSLRGRWEKTSMWATVRGTGGLIAIVSGMWMWWRRRPSTKDRRT